MQAQSMDREDYDSLLKISQDFLDTRLSPESAKAPEKVFARTKVGSAPAAPVWTAKSVSWAKEDDGCRPEYKSATRHKHKRAPNAQNLSHIRSPLDDLLRLARCGSLYGSEGLALGQHSGSGNTT
ncbi:hypothetical protein B0H17DRAFT_1327434 [Mycena rosella]|uniref:Uncharacterized protein n=1 Tax=Mycena rosella TaxID=1033263 RepID=A0AAD7DZP2_MYCRO|nr:hypothetical protein B0H17DRAFT_1327434 [Mycena rosella]